jgi:hypothetical protein
MGTRIETGRLQAMDKHPRPSVKDALSRFFPAGTSYDRDQASRMIRWLDSCGYRIVEKDSEHESAVHEASTGELNSRIATH